MAQLVGFLDERPRKAPRLRSVETRGFTDSTSDPLLQTFPSAIKACTAFTSITVYRLASRLSEPLLRRLQQLRFLHYCLDLHPLLTCSLSRRTTNFDYIRDNCVECEDLDHYNIAV
jgi:hypothetical protein